MSKVAERIARVEKRLYSIKEAAVHLGRSPWTVAEMVRTGKLPYVPDGGRKFLDVNDLDFWIDVNKRKDSF